jgi:hypothetical protein
MFSMIRRNSRRLPSSAAPALVPALTSLVPFSVAVVVSLDLSDFPSLRDEPPFLGPMTHVSKEPVKAPPAISSTEPIKGLYEIFIFVVKRLNNNKYINYEFCQ